MYKIIVKGSEEKQIRKLVIEELRDYKALKVKMENQREQKDAGMVLFSSFKQGLKMDESIRPDKLKVQQVERALASIDSVERLIVEKKYLASEEVNDVDIFVDIGIKKGKYYEKKKSALLRLAIGFGII